MHASKLPGALVWLPLSAALPLPADVNAPVIPAQVHWGRAGSQQPQHLERAASELQQQGQQAASPLMQLDAQQLKKAGAVQGAAVGRVRVLVFSGADAQPGSPAGTTRCGNCASCALSLWPQLDSFFLVAFQTVCAASVFLTIFYWVCVYQPETMAASSPLKHGMSAALMLLDVLLSRIPIMMRHAQVGSLLSMRAGGHVCGLASGDGHASWAAWQHSNWHAPMPTARCTWLWSPHSLATPKAYSTHITC